MPEIILTLVGIFVGIISVTVGGAALIVTPLLLILGLTPYGAIATGKLALFGSVLTGGTRYYNAKLFNKKDFIILTAVISFIGALIGASFTLAINPFILKMAIIVLSIFVLVISIIKKDFGELSQTKKVTRSNYFFNFFLILILSVYSGSIGLGAGMFMIFSFVYFLGKNYLESSALMTVINLATLGGAVIIFGYKGVIDYQLGIPLLIGSVMGGWIGAHYAVLRGSGFIKKLFFLIAIILIIRLLFDLI